MNECQKSVLQRHAKKLADDLILSEDLLWEFSTHRIFDRNMISMIKAQPTENERVYKMLEILPKRGPSAFDTFINIIQDSYPWLATILESSYQSDKGKNTSHSGAMSAKHERMFTVTDSTPRCLDKPGDYDIRKRVGTFVHRQFGQSKRISQNDKKAVEKFLHDQVTEERMRLMTMPDRCESLPDTETESVLSQGNDVQQRLFEIHITLEPHLNSHGTKDHSSLPEDMSFDLIRQEINEILEKLNKFEKEIQQCLGVPGLKGDEELDLSLYCYIEKLISQVEEQEEKISTHESQVKQLQAELNEYSVHIEKLEGERKHLRNRNELLAKEVSSLRHDKFKLDERCEKLEKIHQQHIEKEKTLENLKSVVRDLQANRNRNNMIEGDSMTIRSRETNLQRNSIRRSFRTTSDKFGRSTPRPTVNYQIPRTKYTTIKSGPKKRVAQPAAIMKPP